MLILLIGSVLFSIFIFLSALHFYWGLGGKWEADAAIPTKETGEKVLNPKPFDCFVVAFGMLACGLFILIRSKLLSVELPFWLLDYGVWVLSILFILRAIGEFKYIGFLKKNRSTEFGRLDTTYYSPLCLTIGLLTMILALIS